MENHTKTKIKICGLRRREDILAVNEAKPDYCGFIIEFPRSFRSITEVQVRELVQEGKDQCCWCVCECTNRACERTVE